MALFLASIAEWTLAQGLGALIPTVMMSRITMRAHMIGVAGTVVSLFLICRSMVDSQWRPSGRDIALLSIEPALLSVIITTNAWGWFMLEELTPDAPSPITWHATPLFWIHALYSYGLIGTGFIVALRGWLQRPSLYRKQLTSLLLGASFPIGANILTSALWYTGTYVDLTPMFFLVSGVIFAWSVFHHGLTTIVPIARGLVLERVSDAVVVIAPNGRLLDLNAAGHRLVRQLVPHAPKEIVGLSSQHLFGPKITEEITDGEHTVALDNKEVTFDVRITDLADRQGRSIGRAVVVRDITELTEQRRRLAEANACLVKQVETINRLRLDLAEQASRDPLTGVYNRRYLIERLIREIDHTLPHGSISLILIDVDNFKSVNDHYGHIVGDALLVAITTTIGENIRSDDILARYGGEEFVIVLPGTSAKQAMARAERLRMSCAGVHVPTSSESVSRTISAGVATYPLHGHDPEALLSSADKALYKAKNNGRNQAVLALTP